MLARNPLLFAPRHVREQRERVCCRRNSSSRHIDDENFVCDVESYQRRMWCRAEQICHAFRNGLSNMWLTDEDGMHQVDKAWFEEALDVFSGELTCCRLEHKNMTSCDRQSLVTPLLGLYGELYSAAHFSSKDAKVDENVVQFLSTIEEKQDVIFPRSFERISWKKKKRIVEEVELFGDLIERMRLRVRTTGLVTSEEENIMTHSSSEKNAAGEFVRHGGMRHGTAPSAVVAVV